MEELARLTRAQFLTQEFIFEFSHELVVNICFLSDCAKFLPVQE